MASLEYMPVNIVRFPVKKLKTLKYIKSFYINMHLELTENVHVLQITAINPLSPESNFSLQY